MFRILRRTLGPGEAVEDAVQEVFLRMFGGRRSLHPDSDLRLFVLKTTARVAYLCLRMGGTRWPRWIRRWRPQQLHGRAGRTAREVEQISTFFRALDELPPLDRVAFVLRFVERLELREVATVVNVSPIWLEPRLTWNLAKMSRALEEGGNMAGRSKLHPDSPIAPFRPAET